MSSSVAAPYAQICTVLLRRRASEPQRRGKLLRRRGSIASSVRPELAIIEQMSRAAGAQSRAGAAGEPQWCGKKSHRRPAQPHSCRKIGNFHAKLPRLRNGGSAS